jgi:hypothetical protein
MIFLLNCFPAQEMQEIIETPKSKIYINNVNLLEIHNLYKDERQFVFKAGILIGATLSLLAFSVFYNQGYIEIKTFLFTSN